MNTLTEKHFCVLRMLDGMPGGGAQVLGVIARSEGLLRGHRATRQLLSELEDNGLVQVSGLIPPRSSDNSARMYWITASGTRVLTAVRLLRIGAKATGLDASLIQEIERYTGTATIHIADCEAGST